MTVQPKVFQRQSASSSYGRHKFVVTEPPATIEEAPPTPAPLTQPPPTTGEVAVTLFRKLRQKPTMSIENIQDFYQTWCSEVSKNENEFSLLVNNPGDMAMALLRLQNDLCEQA